jgi:hypothetical protein
MKRKPKKPVKLGPLMTCLYCDGGVRNLRTHRCRRGKKPLEREARASVKLDGETQSCEACSAEAWLARDVVEITKPGGKDRVVDSAKVWIARPAHRCGRREITEEERLIVSEIVRACEVSPHSHTAYVHELVSKLRAKGWRP